MTDAFRSGFVKSGCDQASIEDLLQATAAGDRLAFNRLYDASAKQIFGIVLRLCGQRDVAEDLLQEFFVTVWKKAPQFDPALGAGMAWMTVIARNKAIDRLRTRNRSPKTVDYVEELKDTADIPMDLTDSMSMRRCLQQLKGNYRNAVLLTYLYGFTNAELSDTMAVPLGTVKSWVRRGISNLKACMEQ